MTILCIFIISFIAISISILSFIDNKTLNSIIDIDTKIQKNQNKIIKIEDEQIKLKSDKIKYLHKELTNLNKKGE